MNLRLSRPRVVRCLFLLSLIALGGTALGVARGRLAHRPPQQQVARAPAPPVDHVGSHAAFTLDVRRQQLIGVRTARVTRESVATRIRAAGTVRYDEALLTDVNLKVEGWIRDLFVTYLGQRVTHGQPLFTAYSPALVELQANLLGALKAREQSPVAQAADRSVYVDRLIQTPRQRLKQYDVAEEEIRALEETRQAPPAVLFRSPTAGVVIDKAVIKGMHVAAGQTLYRIADLSTVLVEAAFRETEADLLTRNAHVEIVLDALPDERFDGRIVSTHPFLTEEARTLTARISLSNRDGRLKPGMSANVEVITSARPALVVPADAVVDSGRRQIVFVAQGNGRFEPRPVVVGAKADERVRILDGLRDGEEIATRAAFFLDSESKITAALRDYEAPPSAGPPIEEAAHVSVHVSPDPPRAGENVVQVQLKGRDGHPIVGADLQVQVSMPAMPSMNMPAMRSDARLRHVGNGLYRGNVTIGMAGRWDLNVTALRQQKPIGAARVSLFVR